MLWSIMLRYQPSLKDFHDLGFSFTLTAICTRHLIIHIRICSRAFNSSSQAIVLICQPISTMTSGENNDFKSGFNQFLCRNDKITCKSPLKADHPICSCFPLGSLRADGPPSHVMHVSVSLLVQLSEVLFNFRPGIAPLTYPHHCSW